MTGSRGEPSQRCGERQYGRPRDTEGFPAESAATAIMIATTKGTGIPGNRKTRRRSSHKRADWNPCHRARGGPNRKDVFTRLVEEAERKVHLVVLAGPTSTAVTEPPLIQGRRGAHGTRRPRAR